MNDASRDTGIATGTREAPTGTLAKMRQLRETASSQPRRATEATHLPHDDRTGFPVLPMLGVTDRCRLEPRRALAMPAKSLNTTAGFPQANRERGIHCWGERRLLRTRPCGPAFGDNTHLWADAGHLRTRPCGPTLWRPDRRPGSGPGGPSPCRELPRRKWHIARVSTRTARVPGVATEKTPPHPCGEVTVEGRASVERPEIALPITVWRCLQRR